METENSIGRLLDPEYQKQTAMSSIRLVAAFFGPEVAQKEAEFYDLSPEEIKQAINAGVEKAKHIRC